MRNLLLDSPSAVISKTEEGLDECPPEYPEFSADYNMILNQMKCIKEKVIHVNSLLSAKDLMPYIRNKLCSSIKLLQESFDRCKVRKAMLEDADTDMNSLCDCLERLLQDVNQNMTVYTSTRARRLQRQSEHTSSTSTSTCSNDTVRTMTNSISSGSLSDSTSVSTSSTSLSTSSPHPNSLRKRRKSVSFRDSIEVEGKRVCIPGAGDNWTSPSPHHLGTAVTNEPTEREGSVSSAPAGVLVDITSAVI